jgi:hypothetical protein
MININGNKFALNDNEFLDTLFTGNRTAIGYYKKTKRGIQLMDHQKSLFAFVVNNNHNERFFVSATRKDNAIRYSFSTSTMTDRLLGFDKISYSQQAAIASQLFE